MALPSPEAPGPEHFFGHLPRRSILGWHFPKLKRCFTGCLHGGASLKVEKAHFGLVALAVESSIAVEDAVENRGLRLYRVFVSRLL